MMDECITNNGKTCDSSKIKEYFPEFYEKNKDLVDGNVIILIEDNYTEVGVLLNTKTFECKFIDYRL